MEVEKLIEALIEGIDNLGSIYIRYNAKSLRKVLEKILNYIKHKEQECEELNSDNRYFVDKITLLKMLTDKYEQALNKIRQYRVAEINDEDEAENDTILTIINEIKEVFPHDRQFFK